MSRNPIRHVLWLALLFFLSPLSMSHGKVVWTELDSAFTNATFVGDQTVCASCHEEVMSPYHATAHGRAFRHAEAAHSEGDCESCHGPRSLHVENPEENRYDFTDAQYSAACMQCHDDSGRRHWHGSMHKSARVECVSCHTVMERRSDTALLSRTSEPELCTSCHVSVRNEMHKASHHPVREGRMDCSSCHNPHGSGGRDMLVRGTVNETCYGCHQEMRGPFVWEHPPAREDCTTCHEPHGSNNRHLLTTQNATLCVSCHQYGGHVNQYRYNRVSTPYGNGCTNCHMKVHGSNHPSGAKFTR